MAVEPNAAPTLPLPPRVSASSAPTVGALLTRASAAVTNTGASRHRECSSPRSLLSRILHRGRRLRLPLPRYCASGAAKEDNAAATSDAAKEEAAAPKVVSSRAEPLRESPPDSVPEKKDALPASLVLLLLSKSAAELSRMAELRAQMERLMVDVRSGGDGQVDSASVVKEPIVCAGDGEGAQSMSRSRCESENVGQREAIDQMEAELETELSRLQLDSNVTPRQEHHQVEADPKSVATWGSQSVICSDSDIDDAETEQEDDEEGEEEEDDDDQDEGKGNSPAHGGVSARDLERRLHELLQSRHEARIAELESALERARRKLKEKEREASRWRDTAKLAARFTDDSRLR